MRWFRMAPVIQGHLRRGIPGLGDAIAKVMVLGEDPELHVLRLRHEDAPGSWWVMIESPSWMEELEVDPNEHESFGPVMVLWLIELVHELKRNHPEVVNDQDLGAMLAGALQKAKEWAS